MRALRKVGFTSAAIYNMTRQDNMLLVAAACAVALPFRVAGLHLWDA